MRNTIISSIRQGIRNAIESVVSALAPIFHWPGTHTLEATTGTDPTFTRATAATFEDFEGLIKTVESSEPRFKGARRVENVVPASEDFSLWQKSTNTTLLTGQTDPLGGTTAAKITALTTGAWISALQAVTLTDSFRSSLWVRRVTGTGVVKMNTPNASDVPITVTTEWQRFSTPDGPPAWNSNAYVGVNMVDVGDEVEIAFGQIENVTGQTNQNPSEYVSTGVGTGAELITNGDFADGATGWVGFTTGWTIAGGVASCDGTQTGNASFYQAGALPTPPVDLTVTYTISNYVAGVFSMLVGGYTGISTTPKLANGTYTQTVTSSGGTNLVLQGNVDFVGDIDNVSVKQASHGANVDGVQYFKTLNANTVTGNVVTEAVGSPLTRANTQFGELMAAGDYFSTPNVVTTWPELDLRARATRSGGSYSFFVGKDQGSRAFQFYLTSANFLGLWYYDSAGGLHQTPNSGVAPPFAIGELGWFRVTLETTTGDIKFYYADGNLEAPAISDYTQLGATQNLGVNDIRVTTGPFFAGAYGPSPSTYPFDGRIYRSQVFNEIDGTTPVVDFDFGDYVSGSTWVGIPNGPELVTNGDFNNGTTGWANTAYGTGGVLTNVNSTLRLDNPNGAGYGLSHTAITTVVGKTYSVSVDLVDANAGSYVIVSSNSLNYAPELVRVVDNKTASGTYTGTFVATTTTTYINLMANHLPNTYIVIDNLSAKENQIFTLEGNASIFQPPVDASGPFGYLAEKASTNLLLQSEDLSTTWSTFRAANAQNVGTAPDGTSTANSLTSNTTGASGSLSQQAATIGTTTTYSYSVYLKQLVEKDAALFIGDSSVSTYFYFDLEAGTVGSTTGVGFTSITGTIKSVGNGWYRCTVTGTSLADTFGVFGIYVTDADGSVAVTSGASILVWGAQVEASTYPTSYIPTTTTAVTRNGDVLIAGDMVTDAAGSAYTEASVFADNSENRYALGQGTFEAVPIWSTVMTRSYARDGTTTALSPIGASYVNRPAPMASTWGDNLTAYKDGSGGTPVAYDGTMGTGNLAIGSSNAGARQWDGTIREVKIFDSELTAAEVGDL